MKTFYAVFLIFSFLFPFGALAHRTKEQSPAVYPHIHSLDQPFRGDLDRLRETGIIRVLVSYSRTGFFIENGQFRGFDYDLLAEYEKFLNKEKKGKKQRDVKLIFIPTPYENLLQALAEGRGEIAAAGLAVTRERGKYARFTRPCISGVPEVLVQNKDAKDIASAADLSGKQVCIRLGSSCLGRLKELNAGLEKKGLSPIAIQIADSGVDAEDILEMVNAGVTDFTVTDVHTAEAWANVLPDIVVRTDIPISKPRKIAWAVRWNAGKLAASLNRFLRENRKGTELGNILFSRYYSDSEWIGNPAADEYRMRLENLRGLFEKYADQYGFDWLAVAALACQESGLNHELVSPKGAVGIMQILPGTAQDKNVGVDEISDLENNIHAGVKYLAFLRDRYFDDPGIPQYAKADFAYAAYNAGPAKIRKIRTLAEKQGLDPNLWFFNVEHVAAGEIGAETVNYVANINKYYVAYKGYFGTEAAPQENQSLMDMRKTDSSCAHPLQYALTENPYTTE